MIKKGGGIVVRAKNQSVEDLRENHKLNFANKAIAGHHLISNCVVKNLTQTRKDQLVDKGWSMNHGYNILLLPMISNIACQYDMPCHEENKYHTEHDLFKDFYTNKNIEEHTNEMSRKSTIAHEQETIKKTKGYHKVVATELAVVLKGMTCDTNYIKDVNEIDDLSFKLSNWISKFQLLLTLDGRRYSLGHSPNGCEKCKPSSIKIHFRIGNIVRKATLDNKKVDQTAKTGRFTDPKNGSWYVITQSKPRKNTVQKLVKYKLLPKVIPSKKEIDDDYKNDGRILTAQELMNKL